MYYVLVVTTTQFTYIHGMNYTLHHTHTHMSYVQIFYRQTYNKIDMSDRYNKFESFWFLFFFHVTCYHKRAVPTHPLGSGSLCYNQKINNFCTDTFATGLLLSINIFYYYTVLIPCALLAFSIFFQ